MSESTAAEGLRLTPSPGTFCQWLLLALSMKGMRDFWSRANTFQDGSASQRAYGAVISRLEKEMGIVPKDDPAFRSLIRIRNALDFSNIGTSERFRHHIRQATPGIAASFNMDGLIDLPSEPFARSMFEREVPNQATRDFMSSVAGAFYDAYFEK